MRGIGSRPSVFSGGRFLQGSALHWSGLTGCFRRLTDEKSTKPSSATREKSGMGGAAIATIPMG